MRYAGNRLRVGIMSALLGTVLLADLLRRGRGREPYH